MPLIFETFPRSFFTMLINFLKSNIGFSDDIPSQLNIFSFIFNKIAYLKKLNIYKF